MHRTPLRRSPAAFCLLLVALVLSASAAPAHAADPSRSTACAASSTPFTQIFNRAPWYDTGRYTLSPGGDLESATTGWAMAGGAAVTSGSESYYVGGSSHRRSLALPAVSTATSPVICVGLDYPWMRFFLRNTGASTGRLKFEVRGISALGVVTSLLSTTLSGATSWQLSPRLLLLENLTAVLRVNGLTPVAFRFTPSGGSWQIDDLYVDPYRSR